MAGRKDWKLIACLLRVLVQVYFARLAQTLIPILLGPCHLLACPTLDRSLTKATAETLSVLLSHTNLRSQIRIFYRLRLPPKLSVYRPQVSWRSWGQRGRHMEDVLKLSKKQPIYGLWGLPDACGSVFPEWAAVTGHDRRGHVSASVTSSTPVRAVSGSADRHWRLQMQTHFVVTFLDCLWRMGIWIEASARNIWQTSRVISSLAGLPTFAEAFIPVIPSVRHPCNPQCKECTLLTLLINLLTKVNQGTTKTLLCLTRQVAKCIHIFEAVAFV